MKIISVDDHPLIRAAIESLVAGVPGWRFVGQAGTAREALLLLAEQKPDIVVLDIAMPGMDGVIATREIRRRAPGARVVILTAHGFPSDVRDALAAGARAYVPKSEGERLVDAITAVARGERYLAPGLASRMAVVPVDPAAVADAAGAVEASSAENPAGGADRTDAAERAGAGDAPDALAALSEREREVFRMAAECLSAHEIARELCISRKTVDTHLYRIHRKLGLRNLAELVRRAVSLGLHHAGRTRHTPIAASPPPRDDG